MDESTARSTAEEQTSELRYRWSLDGTHYEGMTTSRDDAIKAAVRRAAGRGRESGLVTVWVGEALTPQALIAMTAYRTWLVEEVLAATDQWLADHGIECDADIVALDGQAKEQLGKAIAEFLCVRGCFSAMAVQNVTVHERTAR